MTAREAINAVGAVVLSQFGEDVWHLPAGVLADRVKCKAVVDWSAEQGSNEIRGDGVANLNANRGRSVRRSVSIDLAVTVEIEEDGKDKFQITNPTTGVLDTFAVKRIVARDGGLQTILLVKSIEHQAQPGRRQG